MDVNQEEIKSEAPGHLSVEDLPLLVMKKIFNFLPTTDKESAMQVCSRWHDIISFDVGLTVFIGNGLVYNFEDHKIAKWRPLDVLSKVGINKCLFGEMIGAGTSDYDAGTDNDMHAVEGFMLPELVEELSFYGKISNELFRVILTPVYWLTTLKIHLTVFRLVSFENYTLRLYSLTYLRIFYTHPVFHLSFPFKDDDPQAKKSVHENITKFLNTCNFRRIKKFEFVGPYFVDKTKNMIDTVREFVVRHHVSLKELILSFPYEWNVENTDMSQQAFRISNESLSTALASKSEKKRLRITQRMESDWGNVQLRRLQVVCPATIVPPILTASQIASSWSDQSLNGMWEALLEKQGQMTSLQYINKHEDWTFPQEIFVNNSQSLKVISLSVNSKFNVDCNALSCCKGLARLSLEGNYFHDQEINGRENGDESLDDGGNYAPGLLANREGEDIGKLVNIHSLPGSLQEICFSKLLIPVSELEVLVDVTPKSKYRFPNLESLQLYQICRGWPQFGLTVLAVERLFERSNMSVSFWQALNCTSFEGAISKALNNVVDSAEVMTLMKVLKHCGTEDDGTPDENLRFLNLYDCHVQLILKSKKPTKA